MGVFIVSKGGVSVSVPLKIISSLKMMPEAVLAKKEPPISKEAFGPKTIPARLIKNKLAPPDPRIIPSILEIFPPVTRLKIFTISLALLKEATPSVGMENSLKL